MSSAREGIGPVRRPWSNRQTRRPQLEITPTPRLRTRTHWDVPYEELQAVIDLIRCSAATNASRLTRPDPFPARGRDGDARRNRDRRVTWRPVAHSGRSDAGLASETARRRLSSRRSKPHRASTGASSAKAHRLLPRADAAERSAAQAGVPKSQRKVSPRWVEVIASPRVVSGMSGDAIRCRVKD